MHQALAYNFVLSYFSKTLTFFFFLENFLLFGFRSVDLVMQFSDTEEAKINFPSSKYENRLHKIALLFAEHIKKFEDNQLQPPANVPRIPPKPYNPGGHEYQVKTPAP